MLSSSFRTNLPPSSRGFRTRYSNNSSSSSNIRPSTCLGSPAFLKKCEINRSVRCILHSLARRQILLTLFFFSREAQLAVIFKSNVNLLKGAAIPPNILRTLAARAEDMGWSKASSVVPSPVPSGLPRSSELTRACRSSINNFVMTTSD